MSVLNDSCVMNEPLDEKDHATGMGSAAFRQ